MADGYLEKHQQDYEARKAAWLQKKAHRPTSGRKRLIAKPDDEAL